jgi:hypothetical protein
VCCAMRDYSGCGDLDPRGGGILRGATRQSRVFSTELGPHFFKIFFVGRPLTAHLPLNVLIFFLVKGKREILVKGKRALC